MLESQPLTRIFLDKDVLQERYTDIVTRINNIKIPNSSTASPLPSTVAITPLFSSPSTSSSQQQKPPQPPPKMLSNAIPRTTVHNLLSTNQAQSETIDQFLPKQNCNNANNTLKLSNDNNLTLSDFPLESPLQIPSSFLSTSMFSSNNSNLTSTTTTLPIPSILTLSSSSHFLTMNRSEDVQIVHSSGEVRLETNLFSPPLLNYAAQSLNPSKLTSIPAPYYSMKPNPKNQNLKISSSTTTTLPILSNSDSKTNSSIASIKRNHLETSTSSSLFPLVQDLTIPTILLSSSSINNGLSPTSKRSRLETPIISSSIPPTTSSSLSPLPSLLLLLDSSPSSSSEKKNDII